MILQQDDALVWNVVDDSLYTYAHMYTVKDVQHKDLTPVGCIYYANSAMTLVSVTHAS